MLSRHVAISTVKEDFIDFNTLKGLLNPSCFQLTVDVVSVTANCE